MGRVRHGGSVTAVAVGMMLGRRVIGLKSQAVLISA